MGKGILRLQQHTPSNPNLSYGMQSLQRPVLKVKEIDISFKLDDLMTLCLSNFHSKFSRAVASLTVSGGQVLHFPHFFSQI